MNWPIVGGAWPSIGPLGAVAAVSIAQSCYSASFGGHHAYVKETVQKKNVGKLVGLTNSVSIIAGLASNIICGFFLSYGWGYPAVFALTAVIYTPSFVVFVFALDGRTIAL